MPLSVRFLHCWLVPSEKVSRVDLLLYIIQIWIVAICNDGLAALFERGQVIYYFAAEKRTAILEGRLVDDDGALMT